MGLGGGSNGIKSTVSASENLVGEGLGLDVKNNSEASEDGRCLAKDGFHCLDLDC